VNKKILVIYHRADFDGIFCREIAKRSLGEAAEYVGWDYGDEIPSLPPGIEQIYMLDISIEALMDDSRLIWIDHHKSAIEKFAQGIHGYRIDGVAACRLVWQWFLKELRNHLGMVWLLPDKIQFAERLVEEPLAVRLAGEYDIWDKRDPRAELFQHGLRSKDLTDHDWKTLLSTDVDGESLVIDLLQNGKVLQYAQTKLNESIIKNLGFDLEFEGLRFLACNHASFNSFLFTAGIRPDHDALMGFKWDGKNGIWKFSLYHAPGKDIYDLSQIAKKFGGGGHRGACGFELKGLPFLDKEMLNGLLSIPHSTDARVWAKDWLNTIKEHPTIPTDEGTMIGWFSNAIMAGYDEAQRRLAKQ
jgi:hypothetical protein